MDVGKANDSFAEKGTKNPEEIVTEGTLTEGKKNLKRGSTRPKCPKEAAEVKEE